MHTSSLVLAAVLAVASLSTAEPENRPKIYFPRHVKRQYTNHTITSSASQSTRSDSADSSSHSTTKKDTISDLLSSLLGGTFDGSDSATGTTTSTPASTPSVTPTSSLSTIESSGSESKGSTLTSSHAGSTGGTGAPLISLPTLSLDIPTLLPPASSDASSVVANKTSSATDTTAATTTSPLPTATESTISSNDTTTDLTATVPTSSSGIVIAPTGIVTPTSTSSDGGLIGGVTSLLGGVTSAVLPAPTANSTDSSVGSSTDTDSGLLPTIFPGTTSSYPGTAPTASSSVFASSSTDTPILSLPPILGTDSSTVSTPTIIPTVIGNTTESSTLSTGSSSTSLPLTTPTTVPSNTTATDSTSLPTITSPTVPINSTVSQTELPTTESSSIFTIPQNTTLPSVTTPEPTTVESTSTASTLQPTIVPITSSSSTSVPAVTSVPVVGTITNSESWLPSTIIVQPSNTISTSQQTTATAIPSSLPQAITPWTDTPKQPDGTTLIQISFLFGENYQHLVDEPLAASQMFDLLPQGLAHGGGYDISRVVMYNIRPYNTIARYGYITSQAMVYYPTEGVAKLADDIGYPTTPLYNNKNPLVNNLTNEINPAIGIIPGDTLDGVPDTAGGSGSDSSDPAAPNNDPFDTQGPGEKTTSAQQGMTAGIAVGAASVAGAYGAAMFIIARRYKRKKQRHQRSSSVTSPSEMRQTGSPALMGGALLSRDFTATSPGGYGGVGGNTRDSQGSGRSGMNNSARTATISAPVAAENSLGWN